MAANQPGVQALLGWGKAIRSLGRVSGGARPEIAEAVECLLIHENGLKVRKGLSQTGEDPQPLRVDIAPIEEPAVAHNPLQIHHLTLAGVTVHIRYVQ